MSSSDESHLIRVGVLSLVSAEVNLVVNLQRVSGTR